jgi:hypothetical protein
MQFYIRPKTVVKIYVAVLYRKEGIGVSVSMTHDPSTKTRLKYQP